MKIEDKYHKTEVQTDAKANSKDQKVGIQTEGKQCQRILLKFIFFAISYLFLPALPILWFWSTCYTCIVKSLRVQHWFLKILVFIMTSIFPSALFLGSFLSLAYLSAILLFTYTGLLLNFYFYGKIVTSIGSAGAVIASMNLYYKYCKLLRIILTKAQELDNAISEENENNSKNSKLILIHEGLPFISLDLYNHCVKRLLPVTEEVIKFLMLASFTILILIFSFSVTLSVESSVDLPAVIGQVLLPLFAAGLLPLIARIMTSNEEVLLKDEAQLQKLALILKNYKEPEENEEQNSLMLNA